MIKKILKNMLPDKIYIKYQYKKYYGRKPNLKCPKLLSEKIAYLKLYDHNPNYSNIVDKISMKEYVSKIVGSEYVVPLLGVWKDWCEIDFNQLPNSFVLKANADSGSVFAIKDKLNFNKEYVEQRLTYSLKHNYYYNSREWPYKKVKRKILAESFLFDENNQDALVDYKFFCFNGKPKIMYIGKDRGNHPTSDWFDMNFNKVNMSSVDPNSNEEISKPIQFDEMMKISEKLSSGIPLLRVDFYIVNNKCYVGELTFYHNAGFFKFKPQTVDEMLGDMLDLKLKHD